MKRPQTRVSTKIVPATTQAVIDWRAASAAVQAAARAADKANLKVNVAVVDRSGLLAGFLRMPGAPLHSIDIALDKAYTAASFALSTSEWHRDLKSHSPAVSEGLRMRPRFVGFGGGLPIRCDGELIGGIGVSGATEEQDEQCARAGLAVIGADAIPT